MNPSEKKFPRGLKQPETGHRFSIDSVFLSCFVVPKRGDKIVDIGCGCGVISIGILLKNKDMSLQVTGIDFDKTMIELSQKNAEEMGIKGSFKPVLLDIKDLKSSKLLPSEGFDIAVINPPYRDANMGRLSPHQTKNPARFEQHATLKDFIYASRFLLKNRGRLYLVYLTERLGYLFSELKQNKLEPKRLRFIHGKKNKPSKIFLLEAIKNGRPSLIVEPPLIQYENTKDKNIYTRETISFLGNFFPKGDD